MLVEIFQQFNGDDSSKIDSVKTSKSVLCDMKDNNKKKIQTHRRHTNIKT